MIRVKLFTTDDYSKLEMQINNWLQSNPGIEIKYITQSQDAGQEGFCGTALLSIWYERPA